MNKSQNFEVWVLKVLVEPELDEDNQQVWRCHELARGTIRQCMEHAVSLVPKYHGWGLTRQSIAEAWDDIFLKNPSSAWVDSKRENFLVQRVESFENQSKLAAG
jgi:hypothetical protein